MGKSQKAPADFKNFINEFSSESDRSAVILGVAQLDILLYQVLQQTFVTPPSASDELLDSDRALGTFSARINAAYRVGAIDAELCRALHLIRKIRNQFAHEAGSTSLSMGAHRDRVRELVAPFRAYGEFIDFQTSFFNDGDESSDYFKAVLVCIMGRLRGQIDKVTRISNDNTISIVPPKWTTD